MVLPSNGSAASSAQPSTRSASALGAAAPQAAPGDQADPPREVPAHPLHLGPDARAAGVLDSMTITELQYDALLNPHPGRGRSGWPSTSVADCSDDAVAKGALKYSTTAKEAQAIANLANTVAARRDLIPF